jgi:hypothetical protein
MRALQFTAGSGVSYNRQFRGKNIYFAYISEHSFTYILFIIIIIIIIIISLFMPRYSVFAHVNQLDLTTYRRMQLKNSTKHNNICTSNYN